MRDQAECTLCIQICSGYSGSECVCPGGGGGGGHGVSA